MKLTQEILKSLVYYGALTGRFILKVDSQKKKKGDYADGINKPHGYRVLTLPGYGQIRAHRAAFLYMLGDWPCQEVDHINGIRGDNRWINLRPVTPSENRRNTRIRSDNISGVVGVGFHNKRNQWRARIGKRHLGWFKTFEEAVAARQSDPEFETFTERHGK